MWRRSWAVGVVLIMAGSVMVVAPASGQNLVAAKKPRPVLVTKVKYLKQRVRVKLRAKRLQNRNVAILQVKRKRGWKRVARKRVRKQRVVFQVRIKRTRRFRVVQKTRVKGTKKLRRVNATRPVRVRVNRKRFTAPSGAATPLVAAAAEPFITELNQWRRNKFDLPGFTNSRCLNNFAQAHSQLMADTQRFEHSDAPTWGGRVPADFSQTCGGRQITTDAGGVVLHTHRGENIARMAGVPKQRLASTLFEAWRDSRPHRENFMTCHSRDDVYQLGFGAVKDKRGRVWATTIYSAPRATAVSTAKCSNWIAHHIDD